MELLATISRPTSFNKWSWLDNSCSTSTHHSLHFHIYQIASLVPGILCPLYCYYKWWGDGIDGAWLNYNRMWEGDRGWVLSCSFCFCLFGFFCCFFFTCAFLLCSLMSSVPCLKWLEHDSCCDYFFVLYLFSLSLIPLTRSYWCIEIAVSVM